MRSTIFLAKARGGLMSRLGLVALVLFVIGGLGVFSASAAATPCTSTDIRWASSSNTIYIFGENVVCTLMDIDQLVPKANLALVNPTEHIWFLGTNLVVQQGATLQLHGTSIGGDVDYLRLKSNNTSTTHSIVWIRADWGIIDIDTTKITSWDEATGETDKEYEQYRRSFIQARSRLALDGVTPNESHMNIKNSEIGYLGYAGAEAYGLSWKVNGKEENLFDLVNIYGEVINNRIHHNYFGAYTYGAEGMHWQGNELDNNVVYGLDPHDNSDNLVIEDNDAHHNGSHGIICSRFCDHLIIRNNVARDNGGNGIMLHRLTDFSLIEGNETFNNSDSGIAVFDSHHNTIRGNRSYGNAKGIRFSVGSSHNLVTENQIHDNDSYGLYFYQGSDAPTNSGDSGRPHDNQFINNEVSGSGIYGLKMKETDDNLFQDNHFTDNGRSLLIELSSHNRFENNTIEDNSETGIVLSGASDHELVGNLIEHNGDVGIYLKKESDNAVITNNTIRQHNKYGIRVVDSEGVTIEDNIFEDNGQDISS
ncbi:MAG: right-handed parallel beta-helix repeat-containing protein [Candidatus Andersenbacteria bacterium]